MLKLLDINHAYRKRIVLAPYFCEGFKAVVANSDLLLSGRCSEAFQDNGDEEVEEDKADHEDEGDEVEVRDLRSTTLDSISLLRLVRLVLDAAEINVGLSCAIVHKLNPTFACGNSQKSQNRPTKILEISMAIQSLLKLDFGE